MARKQVLVLVIIGAMIVVAGILSLGDLRNNNHVTTGTVTAVTADVQSSGIVLAVAGNRQSCESITSWEQQLKGDLIVVTPVFTVAPDVNCEPSVPFEESVAVTVGDLPAATYRIDVLGVVIAVTVETPIISFDLKNISADSFARFSIPVVVPAEKAELDLKSFSADMPIAELQKAYGASTVSLADRLTVITLPCSEGSCKNHYVVDMASGALVRRFASQFGIRAQAGSRLLIVNDPEAIAAAGVADPVVAEAYVFDIESRTFSLVAQGDYLFGELQN